ncbi:methyltransferase domain-containing protein [Synechococcus sp. AH-603-M21]|nr:methyltransferase domain-containing protein [Synechococcus sp. AH-603-M21]
MSAVLLELLNNGDSLIHIGAHFAEERVSYKQKGISVMWVEACPLFEDTIKENLKDQPDQLYRICALDKTTGRKKVFNISNNHQGVSSSFYEFGKDAKTLWPELDLHHVDSICINSKTLDNFIDEESHWISTKKPRVLLIDVQGSELDVLLGGIGSLWRFDLIQIETSNVNVYENGNTRDPVIKLLSNNGFKLTKIIEQKPGHGDLIFEKLDSIKPDNAFNSNSYKEVNRKRIEHLASLDISFKQKTVLELGSGPGDLTQYFLSKGAYVTSIDGREENIRESHKKFKDNHRWSGFVYDLEEQMAPLDVQYDVIIAYGIMYHLSDPKKFLRRIKNINADLFLLSTCVTSEFCIDDELSDLNLVKEPSSDGTQSLHGMGCRPNRKWLWEQLSQFFDTTYACKWQPNHDQFPQDWTINKSKPSTLTRMIYVCSTKKINSSWALDQLPSKQSVKLFSAME